MRLERLWLEFRVGLGTLGVRGIRNFDDLDVGRIRRRSCNPQPAAGQQSFIFAVELIAMTMALADLRRSISFERKRIWLQHASPCPQAHRSAHLLDTGEFAQLVDDAMRCRGVELARI